LLRALVGQLPATRGRIRFQGKDITREPSHRRARAGIGYVPQGRAIFPALTVIENLRMGYIPRGQESEESTIRDIRGHFPRLDALLDRAGGALSGGEQQLLALARALCGRPKLLLLDEPTEGIQPSIVDEIQEILQRLHRFEKLTIIVVEQSLDFIAGLSERVLLIQKGAITREISADRVAAGTLIDELGEVA
jgi:ABC-type branched-subunit amino acid transport system ATPase component